jgi:serine/threonine protein kinase
MEWGIYVEDENFKCHDAAEPYSRSQYLVYKSGDWRWHVKATFQGPVLRKSNTQRGKRMTRRQEFREFILLIEFSSLSLLDDTITEIEIQPSSEGLHSTQLAELPLNCHLNKLPTENAYRALACQFVYQLKEDIFKRIYPRLPDSPGNKCLSLSQIITSRDIAPGVSLVHLNDRKQEYIFKAIDRPLYQPRDSDVLQQELLNLQRVQACSRIVHLVAIVTSGNPYHSGKAKDNSNMLRGFVLEYHAHGSLHEILGGTFSQHKWTKWPLQIAYGLRHLHTNKITHMDLKPSNIVIGSDGDARLIDISGLNTTPNWTAPELRNQLDPSSSSWKTRVQHDAWAFGMVLSRILLLEDAGRTAEPLHELVQKLIEENPDERLDMNAAIHELEEYPIPPNSNSPGIP